MALTRADLEREVVNLIGPVMELVGLFGGVYDGTNPTLNAAIRDGLERMGCRIADPSGLVVADADLASLDPRALRRLMDWTVLLTLEQVLDHWFRAEMDRPPALEAKSVGGVVTDPLARLRSRLEARVARLRADVMTPYQSMNVPIAVGPLLAGSRRDRTIPTGVLDLIPPPTLAPDGLGWWWRPGDDPWPGGWCP